MSAAHIDNALNHAAAMLDLLDGWARAGWIRDLDWALARSLAEAEYRCDPEAAPPPLGLLAAALLSHSAGRGHLVLDLDRTLVAPSELLTTPEREVDDAVANATPSPIAVLDRISADSWIKALENWALCGSDERPTPLVLRGRALQLRRYHERERRIEAAVAARLTAPGNSESVRRALDAVFPREQEDGPGTNWQRVACANAAGRRFAVITGGPGTGKTHTVIRLLALLQACALAGELEASDGSPLRIGLAAPTGKAAARLNESIAGQIRALDLGRLPNGEDVRAAIPSEVKTLHRLLGARPGTRRFRHDRDHPLPLDLVVVDEASMIDVELMAALCEALRPEARLVLLGDRDQLASVEAGAVLGQLCARADAEYWTAATREWIEAASGERIDAAPLSGPAQVIDQAVTRLQWSRRFDATSGIGALARAVNQGDAAAARRAFDEDREGRLSWIDAAGNPGAALATLALEGSGAAAAHLAWFAQVPSVTEAADETALEEAAKALLLKRNVFQLLTPNQVGPFGVGALNATIERALAERGHLEHLPDTPDAWYAGRPVMVLQNDYTLGLMNGDMGICLSIPDADFTDGPGSSSAGNDLAVVFPAPPGSDRAVRWVLPSRLPRCATAWAMTVHKAQGSEFDHAALVLPDRDNPVLTQELVYTAATRARDHFSLLASDETVFSTALERRISRTSRLFEARV